MPVADWILIGVIVLSLLVGLLRGFIREVVALAVWGLAFVVAFQYSGAVSEMLSDHVSLPSARTAVAFGGLFILVLVLGGLLTWLLGQLVDRTGLTGTDRLLGGVFGALRGVLLIVLLIAIAGFTPLPRDPWWSTSRVIHSLLPLAEWATGMLPENVREYMEFHAPPPEADGEDGNGAKDSAADGTGHENGDGSAGDTGE